MARIVLFAGMLFPLTVCPMARPAVLATRMMLLPFTREESRAVLPTL